MLVVRGGFALRIQACVLQSRTGLCLKYVRQGRQVIRLL
jgi:hypothetical protein